MSEQFFNCSVCDAEEFCRNISQLTELTKFDMALIMADPRFNSCTDLQVKTRGLAVEICVPYALIFLLSVVGNSLVVMTLVRHRQMRTITNMYLLNLAFSDLLLAVFCMPFTLVPLLLQDFVFGEVMCVLIRYLQAVSVAVSCLTLEAISTERYYAICQPLKSRRWQTLSHSYKVICIIWVTAFLVMIPIAIFTQVISIVNGSQACREIWDDDLVEKMYTVLLDAVLLVMPLVVMGYSYARVSRELWINTNDQEILKSPSDADQFEPVRFRFKDSDVDTQADESPVPQRRQDTIASGGATNPLLLNGQSQSLRQVNYERILLSKRRVVKMLCVVVFEYFLCWAPLFLVNTWTVMDYLSARRNVTLLAKALVFLLAYLSSCVHPITYCFMNRRFRQSFLEMFRCFGQKKKTRMLDETSNVKSSKRNEIRQSNSTILRFSSLRKV